MLPDLAVDADIRRAETLPPAAFTDRDVLARELATIFARAWLFVPEPGGDDRPLADVVGPRGARAPFTQLGRSLFLQRGWDDDQLRAFGNTCTHAWFPLVAGPSRGPTLVCGQHGRRFDCTGRFVSQPGFTDLPDFPRACDHLPEVAVAPWRDHLFTRFAADGPTLATTLAPVTDTLVRFPDNLTRREHTVREVAGNWKLHAWNYLDRFHIGYVHRAPGGLADAIDLGSYQTELHGDAVLQWAWARDPADGLDPALVPARFADPTRRVFALWWFVWPNLTLNFYPWGLSVNVYQPVADRPEATRFVWTHYVRDPDAYAQRDRRWLSSQVDAEDVDALAQVERGLRSGLAPRGRFAPDAETGPHWFHHRVSRELAR